MIPEREAYASRKVRARMKRTLLFLIVLTGLSLRVIGGDWGFPLLLHPDEPFIVDGAVNISRRSSFDPGVYAQPAHVVMYANAVLYRAASRLKFGKPLAETFKINETFYYLVSRLFVAVLGTMCIVVAYLVGKEYEESVGIIAAGLVALFPSYVGHSHYVTPDVPLTLLTLCIVLFAIRYMKRPSDKNLIILSLCSAVATSVKYPGVLGLLLIVVILVSVHHRTRPQLISAILKAGGFFVGFVLIFSPYLIMNYERVIEAVTHEARSTHWGADGLSWIGNMLFYAGLYTSMSGTVMLSFLAAGACFIIKREKQCAVPVFFGVLYWIALSRVPLHWERWALPMYTAPLLITAYGIYAVYEQLQRAVTSKRYLTALFVVWVCLGVSQLAVNSVVITARFTLKDTRYVSYEFTTGSGIDKSNASYEGYTPLYPGRPRTIFPGPDSGGERGNYVILSSYMYKRFRNEKKRYQTENDFYDRVEILPLVKEFRPVEEDEFTEASYWRTAGVIEGISFLRAYVRKKDDLFNGPTIKIYRADGHGPSCASGGEPCGTP